MARKVSNKVALSTEVHGDQEVQDGHGRDSKHTVYRKVSTKVIDDNDPIKDNIDPAYARITDEKLKKHLEQRGCEQSSIARRVNSPKSKQKRFHPGAKVWIQQPRNKQKVFPCQRRHARIHKESEVHKASRNS